MKSKLTGIICAAALLSVATVVSAQYSPACQPKERALSHLRDTYGEVPVWTGSSPYTEFTLMMSATGTWTMLGSLPSDPSIACALQAGTSGTMTDEIPIEPTDPLPEGGTGPLHGA